MAGTLYEQIAEDEEKVRSNLTDEGDNDDGEGQRDDEPGKPAGGARRKPAKHEAEDERQEQRAKRGRDGKFQRQRSGDGKASQGDGEDAPDDGEAPSRPGRDASRRSGSPRRDAGQPDDQRQGRRQSVEADDGEEADDDEDQNDGEGEEDYNSPAAIARMRRELREAKARALRAEAAQANPPAAAAQRQQARTEQPKLPDLPPEPDYAKDPQGWTKWRLDKTERELAELRAEKATEVKQKEINETIREAGDQFKRVTAAYNRKNPDYEHAFNFAWQKWYDAVRITNPSWTNDQCAKEIDHKILISASKVFNEAGGGEAGAAAVGPAIYDFCIERFGYVPNSGRRAADNARTNVNDDDTRTSAEGMRARRGADLRTVDRNRRRSASGVNSGSNGSRVHITQEAGARMTNGELANLSPEDWDDLEGFR